MNIEKKNLSSIFQLENIVTVGNLDGKSLGEKFILYLGGLSISNQSVGL